jgi:K+-transporting ATPase ATPase B chain
MKKCELANRQKKSAFRSIASVTAILALAAYRLNPKYLLKNPVMFVTYIASILITFIFLCTFISLDLGNQFYIFQICIWLWLTILFSNIAESVAEKRGKAQAETLKKTREETLAKKLKNTSDRENVQLIPATQLSYNDLVLVEATDIIPGDGQVVMGVASIDESAITGESAPVIRDKSEERNSVTGGTLVLSDWLIIKITSHQGETFLERMISLIEAGKRQKTPNEIALSILLSGMTLIFLIVVTTLLPFSIFNVELNGYGEVISLPILVSLLICLIPTTIGGLLSAIGIAGMDRLIRHNVIATSGRAVEAAGDVSILLLDKTGTITIGNRQAVAFYPTEDISIDEFNLAVTLASLADETPEGKSITRLARINSNSAPIEINSINGIFIPFSAETRVSGIEIGNKKILKGAFDRIKEYVEKEGGLIPTTLVNKIEEISRLGATPLVVSENERVLGVIELKDILKLGIKERLAALRAMGVKSVMITGDNYLTAATIANEAGVDDFCAEATPEVKLNLIKKFQENGELVAMVGDGTNDAPALAQSDVAVAMNTGTQAAKDASNMVDLDSDPTKLIEIVKIGKQLLITRGALTTFSIANDVAKYFAIIPAAFSTAIPELNFLNIMKLQSPQSAILSAVIFNALIIIFLIPLALRGVSYQPLSANQLLQRNMLRYGLGGIVIPFVGIKLIDILINAVKIS